MPVKEYFLFSNGKYLCRKKCTIKSAPRNTLIMHFPHTRLTIIALLALLFLSSCPAVGPRGGVDLLTLRDDLDRESIRRAVHNSLRYLDTIPSDRTVGEWPRKFTAKEVKESLNEFMELLDSLDQQESLMAAIRSQFDMVESVNHAGDEVLFTGYYQPVIEGSLEESPVFRYPIYGRPADLLDANVGQFGPEFQREKIVGRVEGKRFVPYFSRHEIDGLGRLKGKGFEIAWAKDPVDLFFLHIQGSGLLRLQDGRLLQLNYAASNGRPYTSIGKVLLDRKRMREEETSMQSLRRYLRDHPEERNQIFVENKRYIFFRVLEEGPIGNLGVPLTAGRSIATDKRLFPKGALAFIVTKRPILDPSGKLIGWEPFSRFVLNQDTGSAIRGRQRVDLFFGTGPEAAAGAGHMKSTGKLFFLMKKEMRN